MKKKTWRRIPVSTIKSKLIAWLTKLFLRHCWNDTGWHHKPAVPEACLMYIDARVSYGEVANKFPDGISPRLLAAAGTSIIVQLTNLYLRSLWKGSQIMNTETVPRFNTYFMKQFIAFRASVVWNILTPDLTKTSNDKNYTSREWFLNPTKRPLIRQIT